MSFLEWFHNGRCTNRSSEPITVCFDGKPEILGPGQTTPEGRDCDGIIHADGSATKIWGVTGIEETKSKEWVAQFWPACANR